MHILNIIVFLFLKSVFSYTVNQNKNELDAMAKAGHGNKEEHPSSPSQLLSQLAGKIKKKGRKWTVQIDFSERSRK